jgi:hypothetical protein
VQDVDAVIVRVVELGAKVKRPAEDQFYDDRDRQSRDLAEDTEWLVGLLHQLMPAEPEVAGLLALIRAALRPRGRPLRRRQQARAAAGPGQVAAGPQGDGDAVPLLTRARQQRPARPAPRIAAPLN